MCGERVCSVVMCVEVGCVRVSHCQLSKKAGGVLGTKLVLWYSLEVSVTDDSPKILGTLGVLLWTMTHKISTMYSLKWSYGEAKAFTQPSWTLRYIKSATMAGYHLYPFHVQLLVCLPW